MSSRQATAITQEPYYNLRFKNIRPCRSLRHMVPDKTFVALPASAERRLRREAVSIGSIPILLTVVPQIAAFSPRFSP
jgi:hypothetical protein